MGFFQKLFNQQATERVADKPVHISPSLSREIYPSWDQKSGIEAFQENPWVYAAVRLIATEVARANLRLYKGEEEIDKHPALDLIGHPNDYQSQYEFLEAVQTWIELTGESAIYLNTNETMRDPLEAFILDPRKLTVIGDPTKYITGFLYRPNGGQGIKLIPEEVILIKEYDPLNQYRGHAPILSARWSVDSDRYAEEYNARFFLNDATPRSVFTTPGQLGEKEKERFKAAWDALFKGRKNGNKTAILSGGADIKVIQQSNKDMDFATLGDKNRDRILSAFRVPKALLGIDLDVNRASAEAMIYIFQRNTIWPKLRSLEEKLNNELLPLYKDGSALHFAFDDPASLSQTDKLRRYNYLTQVGAISPNEIRAEEGLEPIDGGEEPLIPRGYVPLSMIDEVGDAFIDDADAPIGNPKEPDIPDADKVKLDSPKKKDSWQAEKIDWEEIRTIRTNKLKRIEVKYARKARALFRQQERETVERYIQTNRSAKPERRNVADIYETDENVRATIALFEPLNLETIHAGAKDTLDIRDSLLEFDTPSARAAARNMTIIFAKRITATTEKRLRRLLEDAIKKGQDPDVVADRIRKEVFKRATPARSRMIARTETAKAYSTGQLEAMKQMGETEKSWLTARDERVRHTHTQNELESPIPINEVFSNGCPIPGEGSDPGEVINCRCTLK